MLEQPLAADARAADSCADDVRTGETSKRIPRWQLAVVALACIGLAWWVFRGALDMGYHLDDFVHLAEVQGTGVMPSHGPLELFTFAEPIPDRMGPIQGDYLPWWRADNLLIRFCRPLASFTYYVDYWLFGDDARAFHASSLAWYSALVAGCVALYALIAQKSGYGVWTVLLAGAIFATAREHEGSAAWLAGRYTVIGAVFCVPALLAYHRWRSAKRVRDLAWTLLWFALALLSSEAPIALAGFFFAYEISFARDRLRDRVVGILPVALLAVAWLTTYIALGYGTKHSEWYINPITQPEKFVAVGLREKFPYNLVNLILPAALEQEFAFVGLKELALRFELFAGLLGWLEKHPDPVSVMAWFFNLTTVLLLVAFLVQAVRDRGMRFALIGTLLSLVPLSAAPTPQRVLLLPTVGMAWVFAAFIAAGLRTLARPLALLWPWNLVRLVLGVALLFLLPRDYLGVQHRIERRTGLARGLIERARQLDVPSGDADATQGLRVLLVTSPTGMEALYTPLIRVQQGYGWPEGVWGISSVGETHVLVRTGDKSFRLELDPATHPTGFVEWSWASLFRDDFDMYVGREFRSGVLVVRIAAGDEQGRVFALDVEIDKSLDDPTVWLMTWEDQRWQRRAPPPVGQEIVIHTVSASSVAHD